MFELYTDTFRCVFSKVSVLQKGLIPLVWNQTTNLSIQSLTLLSLYRNSFRWPFIHSISCFLKYRNFDSFEHYIFNELYLDLCETDSKPNQMQNCGITSNQKTFMVHLICIHCIYLSFQHHSSRLLREIHHINTVTDNVIFNFNCNVFH